MRLLLAILLCTISTFGQYTIVQAGTPALVTTSTTVVDSLPSLLKDPSTGTIFMFYQESSSAGVNDAPSWELMKYSTNNGSTWTGFAGNGNCEMGAPANCFFGDGTNVAGANVGVGVTSTGALMVSITNRTASGLHPIGAYYFRSADHGATWSGPTAFTITYPQNQYISASGQFVSIPSGSAGGSACPCVVKPLLPCNSGCASNLSEDLLFSYDDGVTFTAESNMGLQAATDEFALEYISSTDIIGFVRPASDYIGDGFPGPTPVPLLLSTNNGTTWSATCSPVIEIADCVSPNQPQTLFNCATFGSSVYQEQFPWPHVIPAPVGSGLYTVIFGDRVACTPGTGRSIYQVKMLTFSAATAISSQTFSAPAQVFYDLTYLATGINGSGNTTYCDVVPTTGANLLVVCEVPYNNTSGMGGCTTECEQIWQMTGTYETPQTTMSSGGATLAGGASIH